MLKRILASEEVPPARNDSLRLFYEEHKAAMSDSTSREASRCDLILKLRGQKFMCHQFVFKIGSRFLENVMNKNEGDKKKDNVQKFELPDWLSPHALTLFIKFLYLGHLTPSSPSTPFPTFPVLFELLLLAHFF